MWPGKSWNWNMNIFEIYDELRDGHSAKDQEDLLKSILPELVISESAGGKGYLVGNFYSMRFARMVCTKYRSLNLFTAIETVSNNQQVQTSD